MIPDITIKNVQSYKDFFTDFHQRVTAVTGESDVGKSVLDRSLRWWGLNTLDKYTNWEQLRRHDSKYASVESGGVKRYRSNIENTYEVDGVTLKAVNKAVPDMVSDRLQLKDLNFQGQHEAYFLISESAGQVAKTLNKVADLQIIDISLEAFRGKVREAKTGKKSLEEKVEENKEKVSKLQWVTAADKEYQKIEGLQTEAAAIELESLRKAILKVEKLQAAYDIIPDTKEDIGKVSELLTALGGIDLSIAEVIRKVEENQVMIPDPKEDLLAVNEVLGILSGLDFGSLAMKIEDVETCQQVSKRYPAVIDDVSGILAEVLQAEEDVRVLDEVFTEAYIAEDCAEQGAAAYEEGKTAYNEKLKELGQCPLCGGGL